MLLVVDAVYRMMGSLAESIMEGESPQQRVQRLFRLMEKVCTPLSRNEAEPSGRRKPTV